jgi:hypothetical protein
MMFLAERAGVALVTGNLGHAADYAAPLVGTAIMSHVLANPAGPKLVLDYLQASQGMNQAVAGPLAARVIAMATGIDASKAPGPPPLPRPSAFRPVTVSAHAPRPGPF